MVASEMSCGSAGRCVKATMTTAAHTSVTTIAMAIRTLSTCHDVRESNHHFLNSAYVQPCGHSSRKRTGTP